MQPLRHDGLAVDVLSAMGMRDRNMYGFADALRAECVSAEGIARLLTDVPPEGIAVAKSTVIEGLKREGDASRPYSEAILSKVRASWVVYGDESTTPLMYTRLTAERAEMLAVAGSFSSAMIGAIPPDRLLDVMVIDPHAMPWAASAAALGAYAASAAAASVGTGQGRLNRRSAARSRRTAIVPAGSIPQCRRGLNLRCGGFPAADQAGSVFFG